MVRNNMKRFSREERAKAEDYGDYFRVKADNRDLNYKAFYSEGRIEIAALEDFNSNNARILNVDEMADLLFSLDYIQSELRSIGGTAGKKQVPVPIDSTIS